MKCPKCNAEGITYDNLDKEWKCILCGYKEVEKKDERRLPVQPPVHRRR